MAWIWAVPFKASRDTVLARTERGREPPGQQPARATKGEPVNIIQRVKTGLRAAYSQQEGQGLTEYGLILVLIGVVVILMLGVLGGQVGSQYSNVANSLPH